MGLQSKPLKTDTKMVPGWSGLRLLAEANTNLL